MVLVAYLLSLRRNYVYWDFLSSDQPLIFMIGYSVILNNTNGSSSYSLHFFILLIMQFGYIVLTTSAGIMDHEEARRKNVGGKVLGFFY